MDKKVDCKIPNYGTFPGMDQGKMIVGAKQLKKALAAGRARYVILAQNADPDVVGPIEALCNQNHIDVTWIATMSELGRACGIEVGAAAAAVVAEN